MAKSAFRKKQEHKLKIKLKKMSKGLTKTVDAIDNLIDSSIIKMKS